MSPAASAIVAHLDALRGRARWRRWMLAASLSAPVGAVAVLLSGRWIGGLAVLPLLSVAQFRLPHRAELARRIDGAGGLSDALACALDHLTLDTPMAEAQRRAAVARAQAVPAEVVVPRTSWAWALLWLAWVAPAVNVPLLQSDISRNVGLGVTGGAEDGTAATGTPGGPASEMANGADPGAAASGAVQAAPPKGKGQASAPPSGAPAGHPGNAQPGEPSGQSGFSPGVGAVPGELAAGAARTVPAAAAPPTSPEPLTLATERGTGSLAAPAGLPGGGAAVGATPSARDDALSDPARAYPVADAPLIAEYFDRRARRAPAPPGNDPR